MQATWWNRLDVKMPSFCLFMNLFLHWEQLKFLSLLCSCSLNSAALTNLFSQYEQLNCFYFNFWTAFYIQKWPKLWQQKWQGFFKCKQPGGTGLKLMQATWLNRLDVKMPSFCLFMNLFLHWEHLNFLSLAVLHADSILLLWLISFHNSSSWMFLFELLYCILYSEVTQIVTTKMTSFFPNVSNLVEQAWSWNKKRAS